MQRFKGKLDKRDAKVKSIYSKLYTVFFGGGGFVIANLMTGIYIWTFINTLMQDSACRYGSYLDPEV